MQILVRGRHHYLTVPLPHGNPIAALQACHPGAASEKQQHLKEHSFNPYP